MGMWFYGVVLSICSYTWHVGSASLWLGALGAIQQEA